MSTLNIKLNYTSKIESHWIKSKEYFSMQNEVKFKNYFFPFIHRDDISYKVHDIQDAKTVMTWENINILLCVENCNYWKHYSHYNKYGNFGNIKVSIYIYNHFDKFVKTIKYIVIPVIYLQIDYFQKFYSSIKPEIFTPFEKKKFCLFVSRIDTQPAKNLFKKMSSIGECIHIKDPKFDILRDKSCYHDITLLNIFNQFKFICCFENSIQNGYITEKIFNVFFARAIPIYYGPSDKYRYFNKDSFIEITDTVSEISFQQIQNLNKNEHLYTEFLKTPMINKDFDNENYIKKSQDFIDKFKIRSK